MAIHQAQLVLRTMSVLLIVLLTIPISGLGQLLYLCSMTGEIGPRCCCQHLEQIEDRKDATIHAPSCCESVNTENYHSVGQVQIKGSQDQINRILAVVTHWNMSQSTRVSRVEETVLGSRAPPKSTGPPIFVRYCSFLI